MLGGLKAERGRVGRDFGPLLRTPTPPGEMGEMGGVVRVAIITTRRVTTLEEIYPFAPRLYFPTFTFPPAVALFRFFAF